MATKPKPKETLPMTPPVDERANKKMWDDTFDTDGEPNSEARDLTEEELEEEAREWEEEEER